jgi:DNA-binding NarL/FixJ family response regulator
MKMTGKQKGAAASKAAITVSVVEDDEWLRDNLAALLQSDSAFHCVSRHASAEEALAALPDLRPDVVLMDIGLPQMSGIECVRRLKSLLPEVQVLMLTVYGDAERVFAALQAGGSGYLLKRAAPEELFDAIRRVHRGESPMDGQIARMVVQYFNSKGAASQELEHLSPREREVLERLAKGEAYKQIADKLSISIDTLRGHIKSVYQKLHVHSRGEAVAKYRSP